MEINLKQPLFQRAKPDETMREFALALAAVKAGEQWYPSGTAVIIGERLAITAKHLFEKEWDKLGEYSVVASQILEGGRVDAYWYAERVYPSPDSDITILFLSPAKGSQSAADYEWKHAPILNVKPPMVGEGVWGFGYPGSDVEVEKFPDRIRVRWKDEPSITTGEVIEPHHLGRDSSMYKYPCFRTNARFDNGMSGGPVFNSSGDLCGLIYGGLSPGEANGEWTSYVSSLWPLMGTLLDLRLKGFPEGYCYPFRKLAQLGLVNVLNLDQIRVEIDSNQTVRVGLKKELLSEEKTSI